MRSDMVIAAQQSTELDKLEKAVMIALAIHCNSKSGQCNPAIPTLCKDTGWGRTSIIQALGSLESKHWIETRKKHRNSNQYDLMSEPLAKNSSSPSAEPHQSVMRTPVVRPLNLSSSRGGPQVISEVMNRSIKEVNGDLANKVDNLLTRRDLFLDGNGEINVSKVASMILQRDGMPNTVPTAEMFWAVAKCVAYHEKKLIQPRSSQQSGST